MGATSADECAHVVEKVVSIAAPPAKLVSGRHACACRGTGLAEQPLVRAGPSTRAPVDSAAPGPRGRALTREQLLDEVWGRGIAVTDRVIDTHITNLRKKIEPQPSQPRYLVSVRGVGYRFDG